MNPPFRALPLIAIAFFLVQSLGSAIAGQPHPSFTLDAGGRWIDQPADNGDRIPDFSTCGYRQGETPPRVPQVAMLTPLLSGDDTARIQRAIDEVGAKAPAADGFRGALVLAPGEYRIGGTLKLSVSGVVLRGSGKTSVLRATGNTPRALIEAGGGSWRVTGKEMPIEAECVPVGSREIPLADVSGLKVGQPVAVLRHGNAKWIAEIGMDRIPQRKDGGKVTQWQPFTLTMDRQIISVAEHSVTLDAPVVCAIERRWGGGSLSTSTDTRIENIGVEDLAAVSDYNPAVVSNSGNSPYPSDELHASYLVSLGNVKNAWVRGLSTRHFAHGPVRISSAKWITVADCDSREPVSQITGGRRYPYSNNGGQMCLFQDCVSDGARHAFVYGSRVVGPNVFLRCRSTNDHASSEPHHRWSTGGLYDNCAASIAIVNRGSMGSGHGWSGAHFVAWNCRGPISCESPPTAWNMVVGHTGTKKPGPFRSPDGHWVSWNNPVQPASLLEFQRSRALPGTSHPTR